MKTVGGKQLESRISFHQMSAKLVIRSRLNKKQIHHDINIIQYYTTVSYPSTRDPLHYVHVGYLPAAKWLKAQNRNTAKQLQTRYMTIQK